MPEATGEKVRPPGLGPGMRDWRCRDRELGLPDRRNFSAR